LLEGGLPGLNWQGMPGGSLEITMVRQRLSLANCTDRLLPNVAVKAGRLAIQSLTERGIKVLPNFLAATMGQGFVRSQSGEEIPYDVAILTIGIVPPHTFIDSGLKTSKDGALLVNDYLQSVDYPEIFGGGDCIAIQGRPLGRVGVYAVREAPILFQNLLANLTRKPLKPFRPQKRYLLIFNLGDGTGIFVREPFVFKGKLAFTLKNHIDMSFMSKSQGS